MGLGSKLPVQGRKMGPDFAAELAVVLVVYEPALFVADSSLNFEIYIFFVYLLVSSNLSEILG